ncbi:MAG: TerB family tellurite resistance protein [Pseudomonadota bacterium]
MFERLLSLFERHPTYETPLPQADAGHAFGALLVRIAKADSAYLFEELESIDHILAERFGLNPVAAAKYRAECEKLEDALPDTAALSNILVEELNVETRAGMVAQMWEVLLADGFRHRKEEEVVAEVAAVFGLTADQVKDLRPAGA